MSDLRDTPQSEAHPIAARIERKRTWRQIVALSLDLVVDRLTVRVHTWRARAELWIWGGTVGADFEVSGKVRCRNAGILQIGTAVRLNSGGRRNYVGVDRRVNLWVGRSAVLRIGDRVGISGTTIVATKEVIVEDDVLLGGGCAVFDTDFHHVALGGVEGREIHSAPVRIGARAFIGYNSTILKGAQIGADAVVGAGSIVTGNIPACEIWAGVPARFIRKRS